MTKENPKKAGLSGLDKHDGNIRNKYCIYFTILVAGDLHSAETGDTMKSMSRFGIMKIPGSGKQTPRFGLTDAP
jgi:hypothetical protein